MPRRFGKEFVFGSKEIEKLIARETRLLEDRGDDV
jgi:hypothetical protein